MLNLFVNGISNTFEIVFTQKILQLGSHNHFNFILISHKVTI
jgi:hypothetical protein